jgi:hypothetical protein
MALTQERSIKLGQYIADHKDSAQALLEMAPEQAVEKINADGFDFSVDELKEFGEELKKAADAQQAGELSEKSLEEVSGGIGFVAGCAIALGCGILVGGMDRFKVW